MFLNIRLSLIDRDEEAVHLQLKFECGEMRGCGAAWFTSGQLLAWKDECELLPKVNSEVALKGGFWNSDATQIEELHFNLAIADAPQNNRAFLSLDTAMPSDLRPGQGLSLAASVKGLVDHSSVFTLSDEIGKIVLGVETEVSVRFHIDL